MKVDRKIPPVLFLLSVLAACSPLARYNTLNFFFDGVPAADSSQKPPDTAMIEIFTAPDSSSAILQSTYAYHQPYQQKQCVACHNQNALGSLVQEEPKLCYTCHEHFNERFSSLHGPVDAGFCSACHDPHMSREKHLLKAPGNALCSKCHLAENVSQPPEHADIGQSECTSCHDPHARQVFRKISKPIPLER